jgi:signal transduction histidine kinase
MAAAGPGRDRDRRRLRMLLAVLFVALAVPTAAVIWQAYSRLKWEAFHQYRSQAEELTRRIDRGLAERVAQAGARRFDDYAFVTIGGDPAAGILQRSALSAYPVEPQVPGLIGYFQVDAEGAFSTPLLPPEGTDPAAVGIGAEEYRGRVALTGEIQGILADNSLVGDRNIGVASADTPAIREEASRERDAAPPAAEDKDLGHAGERAGFEAPARQRTDATFSQQAFDQLSAAAPGEQSAADKEAPAAAPPARADGRANVYGKVQDLQLDDALNRKSEVLEESEAGTGATRADMTAPSAGTDRSRRLEKAALPESLPPMAEVVDDEPADAREVRITTFESEVDPFEFSLLDSGHFVLFRKVWRDGDRYIQGALIEQHAFLGEAIESAFRATALSGMSDLAVGYRDDVIGLVSSGMQARYSDASGMQGALLYRSRLSAPLDALELIFSISRMPSGPGAAVLGWTTLLLAAVFIGGFLALYRLGLGQIMLARQQQDFVSAVSHELKTPLTSIRMYGEMLKEGWVDDARRRQYYEYIHDESERLTRLIENVLRLSSITRSGPDLDLQPSSVGALLDHLQSKIANQVEHAGFELEFLADEDARSTEILVDEDGFVQILINLVDNAIKFSKKAGANRIEIGAALEGARRLRFSVRDYGPGVPRDQMKKIFRLFYRSESELTRETVGTGIGLAIVHQLATAMSGKVDVLNRDPGAEFRVSFPVRSV